MISERELRQAIESKIDPQKLPLECDGLSRVIHTILGLSGIQHRLMVGYVERAKDKRIVHMWNEVDDFMIDYRLHMWFVAWKVPHGVFRKSDVGDFVYDGVESDEGILDQGVFDLLVRHP